VLDRLLLTQRVLANQLQDLSAKLDRLEHNHLSRWHSGNLYLSFRPDLTHTKRRLPLNPPPQAKLFSTSDALSVPTAHLEFRNRRIVPVEVERQLERERLRFNRRQAERARHSRNDSAASRRR
jgi:hypothetical protein